MNDFTQEELVLIACWSANRCEQVGIDQASEEGTIALSHKIQDMIINYCEPVCPECLDKECFKSHKCVRTLV